MKPVRKPQRKPRLLFPESVVERHDAMSAVIRSDARDLPLPDKCVDLIVTSPPFFALRSYRDDGEHYDEQIGAEDTPQEFVDALSECMVEWGRVLKDEGSVWVNLGDKYAGSGGHNNSNIGAKKGRGPSRYTQGVGPIDGMKQGARDGHRRSRPFGVEGIRPKSLMGLPWRFAIAQIDAGWILRAEIIWSKPNGLPESMTDRVRRSHEQWFHFVKEPRYYSAIDEIRVPLMSPVHAPGDRKAIGDSDLRNDADRVDRPFGDASLGRVPGSVWSVPTEPLIVPDAVRDVYDLPDHFAAFPQELPRRIVLGWSPSGICVECGEGRRPYQNREPVGDNNPYSIDGSRDKSTSRQGAVQPHIIESYQCACPEPTAPTRPAVVLDPFGGTGTVAGVARQFNRYGISNDLSADYNRLASWRIFDSGQFEKSHQKWLDEKAVGSPTPTETYLMSFDGIGKVSARAITDAIGNPFVLGGDVTKAKGVGVKGAEKIMDELGMLTSWDTTSGGVMYG